MAVTLPFKARALRPIARALIVAERAWRGFWPGQAFVAGYLALACLGFLADISWIGRLLALAVAVLGVAWGFVGLRHRFRFPARAEAERRLEQDGQVPHRPFAALADAPVGDDPKGVDAWSRHVERMRAAIRRIRLGAPNLSLSSQDPWAVRYGLLLALLGAIVIGGADFGTRLAHAMRVWPSATPHATAIEFWIDPPAYTAAAPIRPSAALDEVRVPVGSVLKAFAEAGDGAPRLVAGGEPIPFKPTDGEGEYALEVTLETSGRLALIEANENIVGEWPLVIVPDQPPVALLSDEPAVSEAGVLRFDYEVTDDYGIASADIPFTPADGVPAGGYSDQEALPAPLPQNARIANGSAFRDLTPHRWAGRVVALRMRAVDAIGQVGESETLRFQLPEREFLHPVAIKIIEARKRLDANPRSRAPIASTMAELMREPADYGYNFAVATAMAVVRARLLTDEEEPTYLLARDLMWETALRLEDGDLSAAERALRMARERLAEALARDASPEEIAKLVEDLKQALQNFVEALARSQEEMMDGEQMMPPPGMEMMQSQDLMKMLDQIRELSEAGARDAARDALAQVDRMLEQLSQARVGRPDMQALRQMMEQLQQMQGLIQQQRDLMDETYRQQQGRQGEQGQQGQRGQEGQQGQGQFGEGGELARRQEALRRALGEIMRQMGENGNIPGNLGSAERSMRDATQGLRQGDGQGAVGAQGQALEHLRDSAQQMARQLAQQMGGGSGGEQQGFALGGENGGVQDGKDPLGRALRGTTEGNVKIPDASDLQRARAIRDEVSRRAGERARPALELEYLERLLKRF